MKFSESNLKDILSGDFDWYEADRNIIDYDTSNGGSVRVEILVEPEDVEKESYFISFREWMFDGEIDEVETYEVETYKETGYGFRSKGEPLDG